MLAHSGALYDCHPNFITNHK